jgi:hypothetical protein
MPGQLGAKSVLKRDTQLPLITRRPSQQESIASSMRLDLLNSIRPTANAPTTVSLLSTDFRVGAILQAVAVKDVLTGELALDIGNQRYPARLASGDTGPTNGEKLTVRILRNSPVLALETVPPEETANPAQSVTSDAMRRYVPRQESPALMLANLAYIVSGKTPDASLPRPVTQAIARLWNAIPEAEALKDPAVLERAVNRSGVLLENQLASGPRAAATAAATDIKALMLALSQALRDRGARPEAARADASTYADVATTRGPLASLPSAPATLALVDAPADQMNELARQTDGALARLTTVQVANAQADGQVQSMLVELPVRVEDRASVLRLKIEHDSSRQNEFQDDSWTVEAAMDLGASGSLHARVSLHGHTVGVQLRADSPAIVAALAARTTELEAMLREAGLGVDRITCRHGLPAADTGLRPKRLLDVRA